MIDIQALNWKALKNPGEPFRLFKPDEEDPIHFYRKIERFKKMLMDKYLYLSDEYRDEHAIEGIIARYFSNMTFTVFYEIGAFQGLMGFQDIIPEWKCELTLKLWDKKAWNSKFLRSAKQLVDLYMNEFQLKRMSTSSPDPVIVKMAKKAEFEDEGEIPFGFKWKGQFFTNYLLGKYREK